MRNPRYAALVPVLVVSLALAPAAPTSDSAGRVATPHQPAVRVLLLHDMEGVSGVDNSQMLSDDSPDQFAAGRRSLLADVNAVIAGLFDGGATSVDVKNTHGGCDDLSCVHPGQVDARSRILVGEGPLDPYAQLADRGVWDVVVAVGMHDKPLSGGFAPHTFSPGISPVINGKTLTETEILGYSFGTVGVPVIFVSGDDRLKRDLAASMPWIEYVVVKRATGSNSAELLPPEIVTAMLREGAKQALQKRSRASAIVLPPSFDAGLLPSFPMVLPAELPGVKHLGDTVTFTAHSYREAYDGIKALQAAAGTYFGRCPYCRFIADRPEFQAAVRQAWDSLDAQSRAFEEGRWTPPRRPAPARTGRYHRVP